MQPPKKHLKVFGYGLAVICLLISFKLRKWHGPMAVRFILWTASGFLVILTTWKHESLLPFYRRWMSVAHIIGRVISAILLTLIFYLIFAAAGILLRILRKDILNERIDPQANSYWIARERHDFNKERYTQQF